MNIPDEEFEWLTVLVQQMLQIKASDGLHFVSASPDVFLILREALGRIEGFRETGKLSLLRDTEQYLVGLMYQASRHWKRCFRKDARIEVDHTKREYLALLKESEGEVSNVTVTVTSEKHNFATSE